MTSAVALRSASLLSICLLLLWVLSPIGGQSSLRLLYETNSTIIGQNLVYYSAPDSYFQVFANISLFQIPGVAIGASLAASEQVLSGAYDVWGHAKVPQIDLHRLDDHPSAKDGSEWALVKDVLRLDNDSQPYTSLTGFNVQGLVPGRHATFNMEYDYLDLDCKRILKANASATAAYLNQSDIYIAPPLRGSTNGGWDYISNRTIYLGEPMVSSVSGLRGRSFFKVAFNAAAFNVTLRLPKADLWSNNQTSPTYFLYGADDQIPIGPGPSNSSLGQPTRQEVHLFQCEPTQISLELYTSCDNSGRCTVEKVRRPSAQRLQPSDDCYGKGRYGNLACTTRSWGITHDLFELWDTVFAVQGSSSLFTDYMKRQSGTPYDRTRTEGVYWKDVTPEQVSVRLTTLLNTFLHTMAWTQQVTRWAPWAFPGDAIPRDTYPQSPALAARYSRMLNVTAANSYRIPVYRANVPWVLTLLFTTTVLVVLATVNLVISYTILAPDIFGYISSLTRASISQQDRGMSLLNSDSLADTGTGLDGPQRARLLKDLMIRVEDVQPTDEVGCIAARLHSGVNANAEPHGVLKRGRRYV